MNEKKGGAWTFSGSGGEGIAEPLPFTVARPGEAEAIAARRVVPPPPSALPERNTNTDRVLLALARGLDTDPDHDQIRIVLGGFAGRGGTGRTRIDLRLWYRSEGEMRPTQKGIALRPAELRQAIEALEEAERALVKRGEVRPKRPPTGFR